MYSPIGGTPVAFFTSSRFDSHRPLTAHIVEAITNILSNPQLKIFVLGETFNGIKFQFRRENDVCEFAIAISAVAGGIRDLVSFAVLLPIKAVLARLSDGNQFLDICNIIPALRVGSPIAEIVCDICEYVRTAFLWPDQSKIGPVDFQVLRSVGADSPTEAIFSILDPVDDRFRVLIPEIRTTSIPAMTSDLLSRLIQHGPERWRFGLPRGVVV
jgi:hypothetical protein